MDMQLLPNIKIVLASVGAVYSERELPQCAMYPYENINLKFPFYLKKVSPKHGPIMCNWACSNLKKEMVEVYELICKALLPPTV